MKGLMSVNANLDIFCAILIDRASLNWNIHNEIITKGTQQADFICRIPLVVYINKVSNVASLVGKRAIGESNFEVASAVGDDVKIEQDLHFSGKPDVSLKGQPTGDSVGEDGGVGEESIGHEREACVAGANSAGGDGDLADLVAPVAEESGAVGVPEADAVGVGDGDAEVEGEVEAELKPGEVDREVEIVEGN
ncbi:glucose-1-phosphate thymidylyltransferase [Striga asiatica]|uniref:Glucose-1-phosphate thymidylyltransferase n=1 Tax=Striga asiatica TaxID=4170 RepID=A0A5A7QG40_STRAF|nr:glucose-1-phosphate thymidylyltransferase [Striga asiatica]